MRRGAVIDSPAAFPSKTDFPGFAFYTACRGLFFASGGGFFRTIPGKTGKKRKKTEKGLDNWGKQM